MEIVGYTDRLSVQPTQVTRTNTRPTPGEQSGLHPVN